MSTYVAKSIKKAKEALAHIEGLDQVVVGHPLASGGWERCRDKQYVILEDQPTLRKWGRTKIHVMIDPEYGSEDFLEVEGESTIEITYGPAPEGPVEETDEGDDGFNDA